MPFSEKSLKKCLLMTLILMGGMLVTLAGCSAFGTIAYIIHGDEVAPPCKKMKGKVAIVCRPRASTSYQYSEVAMELSRALNRKIQAGIKKPKECQVVNQQKVEEYCDGMEAESDFQEIGKAVGADQVIGIDLLSYNHIAGTNVWQGRADMNVQLIDVATGNVLYEPPFLNEYVFPKSSVVAAGEQSERAFQNEYIQRLANYISKQFVPYDRTEVDF
ncbi:MAG: hypothetical protein Q4D62_01290 [Planctomycetia bacterium]|nr:hypothetical protein [Planctomycetia bacterium]